MCKLQKLTLPKVKALLLCLITQHHYIISVKKNFFKFLDDVHLLQFLRAKKFNMIDTMQTFERFYLARKRYPQFFTPDSPNFKRALEIFKTGYCYPLSGRDHEGCRVVVVQTKRLDMEKYSVFDGMRLSMFVLAVLMEEEVRNNF
jgi:hypothetical protein